MLDVDINDSVSFAYFSVKVLKTGEQRNITLVTIVTPHKSSFLLLVQYPANLGLGFLILL